MKDALLMILCHDRGNGYYVACKLDHFLWLIYIHRNKFIHYYSFDIFVI